jgi:glycosyltransferase involved in cell wall biosynthesis
MTQLDNIKPTSSDDIEQQSSENVIAIIPAFNEGNNIVNIVNSVKKFVTTVIVVDDGSMDDTYRNAQSTGAKVIRNLQNRGKGSALKKGFQECIRYNPDIVVTIDADGQHNPEEIPVVIKPIKDGIADMVIGSRYNTVSLREVPLVRGIGLSVISMLNQSLTSIKVKDTQSGFRAYNKTILNIISDYESVGYGAEMEQLAEAEQNGLNIMEVPVTIRYKGLGRTSKQNSVRHGAHIVSAILKIAVEKRPLLIFGVSGLIVILLSLIPLVNLLMIFNDTRYFSIPLALLVLGFNLFGVLLVLFSFIFYALKRIRTKVNYRNKH